MPTKKPINRKPSGRSSVSVSNEIQLSSKNPIPLEGSQAYSFVNRNRYIPFLNGDDNFFDILLESKMLSVVHSSCIETKKNYASGKGLYDVNQKEFSDEFKTYLRRINPLGHSANTFNRRAFGSHLTFGNTPCEIVVVTVGKKKFVYLYAHNVREWRLGWPDADGVVRHAVHSRLFLRKGILTKADMESSRIVPLYDSSMPNSKKNWLDDKKGTLRTMIWLKNEVDGYDYYGMPSSVSSLIQQVLDYKGARYNLDNFENNMVVGGILALQGNLSQTEANKIGKEIIRQHTGDGKRGRVAVVSSEEGIDKSAYHDFNTQKEGSFVEFDEKNAGKIIMAHEWDALLAGISQTGTALGKGNSFLKEIYQVKKKTVIDPLQEFLIENFWTPVQEIISNVLGIDANNYSLGIKDIDPISIYSDIDVSNGVKVNEYREAIGLSADTSDKGNMYIAELGKGKQPAGGGNGNV